MKKRIGIVGSTGSIGTQALDVVRKNSDKFEIVFLSANTNLKLLLLQGEEFGVKKLCLTGAESGTDNIYYGETELIKLIKNEGIDLLLAAPVGAAGIRPVYEALTSGINVALANKESIVAAGRIILDTAEKNNVSVIPVDSEHSAIFQCLRGYNKEDVARIVLTASGGAFRNTPEDALEFVKVEDALNHPNWSMGSKITIDSATMMNKGLELIEARFLFGICPEKLDVVIHPQSIVHSMVSYKDGSMIAQLGYPDMRTPISYALAYPERIESGVNILDFMDAPRLDFKKPDLKKYKCLELAIEVLKKDMNGPMIIMNAANEIAVEYFLKKSVSYRSIPNIVQDTLDSIPDKEVLELEGVLELDKLTRERAKKLSAKYMVL